MFLHICREAAALLKIKGHDARIGDICRVTSDMFATAGMLG